MVNRPGAAGALAADAVLAAAHDSGTLLLGGLDHVAYSHLNSNRRALDPLVDFVPVGAVNRDTWVVVTASDHGPRTLADERLPLPGEPPSVRELGLADQVFSGGLFVFAPAALAPRAAQLNAWLVQALGEPEIVQRYRDVAIEPTPIGLDATAAMVRQRLQVVDAMRLAVFGRTR